MKNILVAISFLLLAAGCRERYNPPADSPETGYLVVEGFINNGTEPTTIKLTRTTKLVDTTNVIFEHDAQVFVEGNNGDNYILNETADGNYVSAASLALTNGALYRIHIQTKNGKEYMSDYTPVKPTPIIDSISWIRDNDGSIGLYINTHDEANATRYYQWEYAETWEFHSSFYSTLHFTYTDRNEIKGVEYWDSISHTPNLDIYKCWKSYQSANVIIGTSEKLSEDRIHYFLKSIAPASQQLSVLYSIDVKQHAVSKNNYELLSRLKKNTEQVGSIFDPQPSELISNIHCVDNPEEQVIGFIEVSQLQEQRIFIKNEDIANWNYSTGCGQVVFGIDTVSSAGGFQPTTVQSVQGTAIKEFLASTPECVDCTLSGSNVKPDFWP